MCGVCVWCVCGCGVCVCGCVGVRRYVYFVCVGVCCVCVWVCCVCTCEEDDITYYTCGVALKLSKLPPGFMCAERN